MWTAWYASIFVDFSSEGAQVSNVNGAQSTILHQKHAALQQWFSQRQSVLVAFSGGIDSTLVLKVAYDVLGVNAVAVTAVSPTLPYKELDVVHRLSQEIGVRLILEETDQLTNPVFVQNDHMRCAHCKTDLYQTLEPVQQRMNITTIVDGMHVDDVGDDRPGGQAARRLGIKSPLVEVGFYKHDIRALARELGLSNWDKPAEACLSSRIPRGTLITLERLRRVEKAETVLLREGFRHVRVRDHGSIARIELDEEELNALLASERRQRVIQGIKEAGFAMITVDLEGYRQGGGNIGSVP